MEHPVARRRTARRLRMVMTGVALGVAAALTFVSAARADEYPSKPIKVIVPFGAGGGTDVLTRIWSDAVGKRLNQRILVENMPGAQGALGSKAAIKADPDGYTLLMGVASTMAINPATMADLGYTHKDVQSVAMIGLSPWLMVVTAKLPIRSVKELIAYGKAHPGELSYPVWSATGDLGRKLFIKRTGVDLLAVPYKGGVAAVTDLITGRISTVMVDVSQVWPQIQSGELRVLAMTSSQRTPILPDVPSIAEEGVKDFEVTSYVVLFTPLGVSKEIVGKLNKETRAALADPDIAKKFATLGAEITDWDVARTSEFVDAQAERWKSAVAETKDVK